MKGLSIRENIGLQGRKRGEKEGMQLPFPLHYITSTAQTDGDLLVQVRRRRRYKGCVKRKRGRSDLKRWLGKKRESDDGER